MTDKPDYKSLSEPEQKAVDFYLMLREASGIEITDHTRDIQRNLMLSTQGIGIDKLIRIYCSKENTSISQTINYREKATYEVTGNGNGRIVIIKDDERSPFKHPMLAHPAPIKAATPEAPPAIVQEPAVSATDPKPEAVAGPHSTTAELFAKRRQTSTGVDTLKFREAEKVPRPLITVENPVTDSAQLRARREAKNNSASTSKTRS